MTKYDDLIKATKALLWEKGYDATSPRAIQALSNAGQGSFYHHFRSKKDLAATALEAVVDERIAVHVGHERRNPFQSLHHVAPKQFGATFRH